MLLRSSLTSLVLSLSIFSYSYSAEHDPPQPPKYKEVMKILKPLEYSYLHHIFDGSMKIDIASASRKWTVKNLRTFDKAGNLVLDDCKYGICGDLSVYVFQELKNIFGPEYELLFVRLAESSFFHVNLYEHVGLIVIKKGSDIRQGFLIDPSFSLYARVDELDNYIFFETYKKLPMQTYQLKNISKEVGQALPVFKTDKILLCLHLESINDKFDKNNLSFILSATKKYSYAFRTVFRIERIDGWTYFKENEKLAKKLFPGKKYKEIKKGFYSVYENINLSENDK